MLRSRPVLVVMFHFSDGCARKLLMHAMARCGAAFAEQWASARRQWRELSRASRPLSSDTACPISTG
jgi:hypothetical protein